jgi:pimeloyl-ACP methyl ester carboxylesterase
MDEGFVDVEGARLYYESQGEGRALVLIHAGVADHRMWDEQVRAFAGRRRVVRYDLRGCGRSQTQDVTFSHRGDLRAIMQHLAVDRAALCGVSVGGQIAIDFTLDFPEMVDALIPVASGVSGYRHGERARPLEAEMSAQMDEAWEAHDFEHLVDLEVRMWVDGPGQPPDRVDGRIRERVRQMERESLAANPIEGKPQPLDPPAVGRLGEIRAPTLVVVGDLDTSGVLAAADLLVRGIPGARRVVFPGTAHMLTMEKPDEFNRLLLEFLG